jgi:hypothetical protein
LKVCSVHLLSGVLSELLFVLHKDALFHYAKAQWTWVLHHTTLGRLARDKHSGPFISYEENEVLWMRSLGPHSQHFIFIVNWTARLLPCHFNVESVKQLVEYLRAARMPAQQCLIFGLEKRMKLAQLFCQMQMFYSVFWEETFCIECSGLSYFTIICNDEHCIKVKTVKISL